MFARIITISVGDPVVIAVAAGQFLTVPITDELRGTGGNSHRSTTRWNTA